MPDLPDLVLFDRDDTLIRVPEGAVYLYGEADIEFLVWSSLSAASGREGHGWDQHLKLPAARSAGD